AQQQQTTEAELKHFIKASRIKLFNEREKRVHPFKDDKILTDWNGLMIAALAKGALILDEPTYLVAARRAAEFLWTSLRDAQGNLHKRYRNGEAGLSGHLDDYTFFTWGLLELYEATLEPRYLIQATELQEQTFTEFWDEINGGFFLGKASTEDLPVRSKTGYDGALPSGNSVAAMNLQRLGRLTGQNQWLTMAETIGRVFSAEIDRNPTAFTALLTATLFALDDPREVVIVGAPQQKDTRTFIRTLQATYTPHKVLLLIDPTEPEVLSTVAPWIKPYSILNDQPTAYICKNYTCQQPTNDVKQAMKYLQQ
ncbi:MAG: thioredoxin domain-containing protein, partial [Fidelibacterota bacterium]